MKKRIMSLMLAIAMVMMLIPQFAIDVSAEGENNLKLYSRNPEAFTVTGEGCLEAEVEITDGKAPACPEEFKFDGWTFWGWSTNINSAKVIYQPGDVLGKEVTELYASWWVPTEFKLGDTTSDGGKVVDKYLSWYTGSQKPSYVDQGNTVYDFDYYAKDAQWIKKEYEIIFPKEYDVIKYYDEANDLFPVTVFRRVNTSNAQNMPSVITDTARNTFGRSGYAVYENVTNLFRRDENGYLYYDSANTHAELNTSKNTFSLYDNLLMLADDNNHYRMGYFAPLDHYAEGSFANGRYTPRSYQMFKQYSNPRAYYLHNEMRPLYSTSASWYFGVTGQTTFVQRPGGKMPNGEDCIFDFCGDDEMHVYIDGIRVLDAGNVNYGYNAISSINFATGEIRCSNTPSVVDLYSVYKNSKQFTDEELSEIFVEYEEGKYRFKDCSEHSFEFFYADTGATISRMMTKFSLLVESNTTELSITKETEGYIGDFADATYDIEAEISGVVYTGTYTIGEEEFEATDGIIKLKAGETAVIPNVEKGVEYKVTELNLPEEFDEPTYINGEGKVADEGTEVTITNSLTPIPAIETITVEKVVDGEPNENETFEFVIAGQNNAPMPEEDTITIDGNGTADFGEITFTEEGTYVYTITETDTGVENYTYDENVYYVQFSVALDAETNSLEATKTITVNGNEETADAVVFTNVYTAPIEEDPPAPEDPPAEEDPPVEDPPAEDPPAEEEPPVEDPPADDTPQTGDNTNSVALFAVVLMSICGIIVTSLKKKSRQ